MDFKFNLIERFAKNKPEAQAIIQKYKDEYMKAWGDPANTKEDNAFMEAEALKASLNSPEMHEAFKQAREEYQKKLESKKDEPISKDLAVDEEGLLVHRNDVLSGEKQ